MNNNSKREINFFSRWRVTRYPKATFTPLELGKYADFTKPVFFCSFCNHWRNFWIVVRVSRAQLGLICVRQIQVWSYLSVDEQCEILDRMDFDAILLMSNICQSFQTLYEASPIINVTHRSFAVFHPIMYVTRRSFAAPAPATRDVFWSGYTIHILYYAGVSIMPPRVLAQRPKPCRGQNPARAMTVCPRHRDLFRIRWKCNKTRSSIPTSAGIHAHRGKSSAPEAQYGLKCYERHEYACTGRHA